MNRVFKKGILALTCMLVSVAACSQEQDWKDLTPVEREAVCERDAKEATQLLQGSLQALGQKNFDLAQRYVDMSFHLSLLASSCESRRTETNELLVLINKTDRTIACEYHIDAGNKRFIRSELQLEQFEDIDGSIRELKNAMFSYNEAMRFCDDGYVETLTKYLPQMQVALDTLVAKREEYLNGN